MEIIERTYTDDGTIPNNAGLPVIIYRVVFTEDEALRPESYEDLFHRNHWGGSWRNGLFKYHHYHSTAHEVLGICSGWADALIGGESGDTFRIQAGDILLLPAGTGHKNLGQSPDFRVVGAYPEGQYPDMNYGYPGERPHVLSNIKSVPLPSRDPVEGEKGPVFTLWRV